MSGRPKRRQPGKAARAPDSHSPAASRPGWRVAGICTLLVALVFGVFAQTAWHRFVNFDDGAYVYNNQMISRGLSLGGIGWAFTHVVDGNWHPLTVILHMADCQVYGLWPGGHHITNVVLHAACVVMLFLVLQEMTGAMWRSGFVAAVFAIHPLRVESVAWVSELKDVLSGLFFMLTLWAYARYVRGPQSKGSYAMVVLWFVLGLMSKPMLVTVPFVLLLVDYWPLGRLRTRTEFPSLLKEKLPLFALSALSCVATVIAQQGAIQPVAQLPFSLRLGNALVAYAIYLQKLVWPSNLAVMYPLLRDGPPAWQVINAVLLLTALSSGAWFLRRREPYLLMGWLWYVGMLVPVIGILQVGHQAYADRYTYLPQIGLCIGITWMAADWAGQQRNRRVIMTSVAVLILCALPIAAFHQTTYWRDSESLWNHMLVSTRDNWLAHLNLANTLNRQGRPQEAIAEYRESLRINPVNPEAHNNLGNALCEQGRLDEGIAEYREALRIDPTYAEARDNIGTALLQQGRDADAIAYEQQILESHPDDPDIKNNLAWMLAAGPKTSLRDGPRAVQLATQAVQAVQASQASQASGGSNPVMLRTLAAAYAQSGQFPKAIQTAQQAQQLAESQGNTGLAAEMAREIKLYEAGHPFEGSH